LRRVADNLPRRVWVVALIGFWERFTFWGLTAPWPENYMANDPWIDVRPGKLALGQATATRIYCGFYIFYYVTPIFVAILSDARLGRFKTLCISAILYFFGSAVLAVTSHPLLLQWKAGLPGLIVAMVLIGLGGGGFRAIIVPFIADQYPKSPPRLSVLKSGEQVVVDHTLTLGYIYTMYYWVGNLGSLSWFATTYMEKYYDGFWPAFALTCCSMAITMLMLLFGYSWYVKIPQEGNVLPRATKIMLCAGKSGFNMKCALPGYQLEHHAKHVSWNGHLVDELRRALRACKVLVAFVVFYICFDQMQNNLISQAGQMETKWMPNDAMPALNQVAVIVFGPIIHQFYIFLHKRKIYLRPIARITIGFAFTSLSMAYATCVQGMIYHAPPCHRYPLVCEVKGTWPAGPNKVNVWVQAPVYVLLALGEIFGLVTALEYSYEHSPKDMKAVIQAISLLIAGLGSSCAMALTPVAKDPHLMILYASLFGAMALTTIVFWLAFRGYDRNYI
ncbi:POT family-domain-containing protein, partial [Lophiotrema nucula]